MIAGHNRMTLDEVLVNGNKKLWARHRDKVKQLLGNTCSACKIKSQWNEMDLVLHLDHINGIPTDNRIENLRLLCPNCHSQTSTYCGRNKKILEF